MHIAIVTKNMGAGGAERVIAQLINEWTKMGVSCTLICMHPEEAFYSISDGVDQYDIPEFSKNYNIDKLLRYQHLRKIIKKYRRILFYHCPKRLVFM